MTTASTTRLAVWTLCAATALLQGACAADPLEADDAETDDSELTAKQLENAILVGDLASGEYENLTLEPMKPYEPEQLYGYRVDAVAGETLDVRVRQFDDSVKTSANLYLVDSSGKVLAKGERSSSGLGGLQFRVSYPITNSGTYRAIVGISRRIKSTLDTRFLFGRDVALESGVAPRADGSKSPIDVSGMTATVTLPLEGSFFGVCGSRERPPASAEVTLRVDGKVPGALTVTSRGGPSRVSPTGEFVFSGPFGAGVGNFKMAPNGAPALPLVAVLRAGYGGIRFTCSAYNRQGGFEVRLKNPVTVTFERP